MPYIFINFTLELSLACSDAYVLYSDKLIDLNFQVFPPPFHLISSFCLSCLIGHQQEKKQKEKVMNVCSSWIVRLLFCRAISSLPLSNTCQLLEVFANTILNVEFMTSGITAN